MRHGKRSNWLPTAAKSGSVREAKVAPLFSNQPGLNWQPKWRLLGLGLLQFDSSLSPAASFKASPTLTLKASGVQNLTSTEVTSVCPTAAVTPMVPMPPPTLTIPMILTIPETPIDSVLLSLEMTSTFQDCSAGQSALVLPTNSSTPTIMQVQASLPALELSSPVELSTPVISPIIQVLSSDSELRTDPAPMVPLESKPVGAAVPHEPNFTLVKSKKKSPTMGSSNARKDGSSLLLARDKGRQTQSPSQVIQTEQPTPLTSLESTMLIESPPRSIRMLHPSKPSHDNTGCLSSATLASDIVEAASSRPQSQQFPVQSGKVDGIVQAELVPMDETRDRCDLALDVEDSPFDGTHSATDMDGVETTTMMVDAFVPITMEDSEMPEYFSDDEEMAGIAEDLAFLDSLQEPSSAMEIDVPLSDIQDATDGVQSLQVSTNPTTRSKGGGAA